MSEQINKRGSFLKLSWLPWFLIVFEMLYMASPFGVFLYSAYKLPLKAMNANAATSFLVQTVLPHFTETLSPLPHILTEASWVIMFTALVVFCAAFFQIYYSKFKKIGAVIGGIYRIIRHPQYTAWTVFGFSMCIVWSRPLVWLMFVIMCFVYYFLARTEERECLEKFPSYRAYYEKTGMFFPRLKKSSPVPAPSAGSTRQRIAAVVIFCLSLVLTLTAAKVLRHWALSEMYSIQNRTYAAVSLNRMDRAALVKTASLVMNSERVKNELSALASPEDRLMIYVMPSEWIVPELGMERTVHEGENGSNPVGNSNHGNPEDTHPNLKRILISRAILNTPDSGDIIGSMISQKPLLIVNCDLSAQEISSVTKAPDRGKYGDVPVPLF